MFKDANYCEISAEIDNCGLSRLSPRFIQWESGTAIFSAGLLCYLQVLMLPPPGLLVLKLRPPVEPGNLSFDKFCRSYGLPGCFCIQVTLFAGFFKPGSFRHVGEIGRNQNEIVAARKLQVRRRICPKNGMSASSCVQRLNRSGLQSALFCLQQNRASYIACAMLDLPNRGRQGGNEWRFAHPARSLERTTAGRGSPAINLFLLNLILY